LQGFRSDVKWSPGTSRDGNKKNPNLGVGRRNKNGDSGGQVVRCLYRRARDEGIRCNKPQHWSSSIFKYFGSENQKLKGKSEEQTYKNVGKREEMGRLKHLWFTSGNYRPRVLVGCQWEEDKTRQGSLWSVYSKGNS